MCYRGRVLRKFVEVIRNVLSKGDWVMGKQVRKLLVFVLLAGICDRQHKSDPLAV